ncbi:MAG: aminotransferase class I/II-fold pyridoxal phosphate-dependent enzyme [Planctomycetes bacterium]|nr:aminotransferase class I/II-fold pyridoxal phosphate-dependent enzyme [Planctomycetota bacterium]
MTRTEQKNIWWRRASNFLQVLRLPHGRRPGEARGVPRGSANQGGPGRTSPNAPRHTGQLDAPPPTDLFAKCEAFTKPLELQAADLYPYFLPIGESEGTEVEIHGKRLLMAGSNNYLGVTHDPRVREAAIRAIERFGSGCTGSRFLNGTLELHEELEHRLAKFLGYESALVFTTGFQTNLGVISSLAGRGDVIFTDRENHASIMDGCRLGFGEMRKFRHNDMEDLEEQLRRETPRRRGGWLIVVDGVFSMLGDLANLPRICELAEEYGARVLVDDAHSIGVMGAHGRGTAEHFDVEDRVDLVLGTFSKSFGSIGGYVAGDEQIIRWVKHHGRSMIFSASLPPASCAATLAALDIIESEPERRTVLHENAEFMRAGLHALGFDTGPSVTPVIPILIGERHATFRFWRELYDHGVFTNPITSPAVPAGMDLIRTSVMATHTREQLQRVLDIVAQVARKLRVA